MFPAVDPADVAALTTSIDWVVEQIADRTGGPLPDPPHDPGIA